MKKIQDYTRLIEDSIAAQDFNTQPIELYQPISYILSLGGKRLRPAMCLAATELFGGELKTALTPALAIEVFHNFSLIHDDIMDKAPLRRGKPTVHQKWDDNIAILSGDAMLVKAYQYVSQVDARILPEVMSLFSQTALEVCEGQQYDLNFESLECVSEEEYIKMIGLKTSVLLACSLKLGALIAGAEAKDAEAIYSFGLNIGIAFQIQDDILDAFGDSETFGKLTGGDILNDKKTILMIQALKNAPELKNWLGNNHDDADKIKAVKDIFVKSGAKDYSEKKMYHYYEIALAALSSVNGDANMKKELASFAKYLIVRDV